MLSIFLQACVENPSYAPVTNTGQSLSNNQLPQSEFTIAQDTSATTIENRLSETTHIPTESSRYQNLAAVINENPAPSNKKITHSNGYYQLAKKNTILSKQHYPQLARWHKSPTPHAIQTSHTIKRLTHNTADTAPILKKNLSRHSASNTDKKIKYSFISVPNNKSTPFSIKNHTRQHVASVIKSEALKTATISIDNKKMLKLAFKWPLKGVVVKNFQQSKNKGIDIAGKIGQRVYAAEAGKVIYGGPWLVGFGNLLIIKHNHIYLSAYANNSQLLVKEGQSVNKGQIIAQVGRTLSQKAALHFEIRKNGKSVNPLRLLPRL
ncbi:murein hydrolase activator EnvC family protein [Crenothrix polyspora]|uniref:murein hydrolase activator EnvC family protein n=1 Tax=Crenothrix polyspora TaxID=360316 RepID=UPI001FECD50F|nr:peptidoglycan DD-metalloendopeptidase family protein [Crenothrix polyspora]